jgi:hypothetical protein
MRRFVELQRRGQSTAKPNVYRELDKLALHGFLTKEDGGYRVVAGNEDQHPDDRLGQLLRLSSISHRSFVFSVIRLSIKSADGLFNCPSLSATARNGAAAPGVGLLREVWDVPRVASARIPVRTAGAGAFQPD